MSLLSNRSAAVHLLAAATACGAGAPPALADAPGAFRFVDSGQRLGNLITTGTELADLDEDGDLDAITPSYLGPAAIWLNQGDGVMIEAANRIEHEFFTSDFELADFSGDGFVDLLAPSTQSSSTLYLNDGTGQFELFQTFPRSASSAVASGDLDGDDDLDAMFGTMSGNPNVPAFNDGTGRLTVSSNGNGPPSNSVSLGDLDGDGDLDAFVAIGRTQSFANWVLLNDGNGFFTDSGQRLGDGLSAAVQIGDLDLDGDLDAFVINVPFEGHSAADMVWLNDGNGTFVDSGQRLGEEHSGDLDLADFDGDGDLDALICLANAPNIVRLNDGAGRFEGTVVVDPTAPRFFKSAVGDLDGDLDVDVFTARPSADGDRVYLNEPCSGACGETICPDGPDDYLKSFGGLVTGDALDLCDSDDVRLEVLQTAQLTPLLPFIRLEFWAHSTPADAPVTSVTYTVEGHVSALVAGGQDPSTLRTSIKNYGTGSFEIVDQRGTGANADETITHVQTANAPDYVDPGDGEVRVKQDVFDPGNVFTPNWFLKVDLYEVVVGK